MAEQTTTEPEKTSKENQVIGQKRPNEGAPIPESIKKHKSETETTTHSDSKEVVPEAPKVEELKPVTSTTEKKEEEVAGSKENIPTSETSGKMEAPPNKEHAHAAPSSLETKVHGDRLLQKHMETLGTEKPSEKKEETQQTTEKEEQTTSEESTSVTSQ